MYPKTYTFSYSTVREHPTLLVTPHPILWRRLLGQKKVEIKLNPRMIRDVVCVPCYTKAEEETILSPMFQMVLKRFFPSGSQFQLENGTGTQYERGAPRTSYITTLGTSSPIKSVPGGILEKVRTNYFLNSD